MLRSRSSKVRLTMLLLAACGGCKEVQDRHFGRLADAQREHMVEKGWVPSFVSPDAEDINFEGDMDAASVVGSYLSSDDSLLRLRCTIAEDTFKVYGSGPKWFSKDVAEAGTAVRLRRKGYQVFRCPDGFDVATLSSKHFVAYWSFRKH